MARRPVAVVAAIVLVLEAFGIALLNWILGLVVDHQEMSMAGLDPRVTTLATWIAGVAIGVYLVTCALVLLRAAVRDKGPARFWRVLLISAAVLHGLLGALCVGLVGWLGFAFMMVVLGLIVLSLVGYDENTAQNFRRPGWLRVPARLRRPGQSGRSGQSGPTPTSP